MQLVLVSLAVWNLAGYLLQLANASLIEIDGIDGLLGARVVGGAAAVLAIAYVYAARNPVRYRFVLWLASLEQFIALFSITFHWARGDLTFGESAMPMIIAIVFLVLLMTNLPRQTDTI